MLGALGMRMPAPPPPPLPPPRLLLFPSRPQTERMRHRLLLAVLLVLELHLLLLQLLPAAVGPVAAEYAPLAPPPQVGNVLDDLAVARRRLAGRRAGQRRRRLVTSPFQPHPLHFPFLGLGELRRYHHQAQVDHEERADLFFPDYSIRNDRKRKEKKSQVKQSNNSEIASCWLRERKDGGSMEA